MREECGISGLIFYENDNKTNVKNNLLGIKLYYSLCALQHRGQDSMGILIINWFNEHLIIKKMGLVSECSIKEINNMNGIIGIGHVRSAIKGTINIENCQPFCFTFKNGRICLSYNGSLVNNFKLKHQLEKSGKIFTTDSDCEIIAYLLIMELLHRRPIESIKNVMSKLIGAYSLTIVINKTLYAIRDPYGIKPLCYGNIDNIGYAIVSESVALGILNGTLIRDIYPGEILEFKNNGNVNSYKTIHDSISAHCIFEYIYLARPDSIIDGRLVYDVREKIGRKLAYESSVKNVDIVCPVPDSGIISALGYSRASNIKYTEILIKNKNIGRTFILPTQEEREEAVKLKFNIITENLKNKNIILIDDSIVRGTTSKRIVKIIQNGGAKSVHVRIASPPIISPCYFGTDIGNRKELIVSSKKINDVCSIIGATTLKYISINSLIECIGLKKEKLCLGCINGEYPITINNEKRCKHTIRKKNNNFINNLIEKYVVSKILYSFINNNIIKHKY